MRIRFVVGVVTTCNLALNAQPITPANPYNQFRQKLFHGASSVSAQAIVRLAPVYDCSSLPCRFVRALAPGSSQFGKGRNITSNDPSKLWQLIYM